MKINFRSTRLAFILISLLIIHVIFSAIIPQKDISEDQIINLEESLGDYYFIIDKLALDRIYTAPPFFVLLGLLALNLTVGNFKRFKTVYKIEKTLLKAKHLGSIIFHLSLVVIIFGVILNYLYKFEGVFSLTEGQTVYDNQGSYFRIINGPLNNRKYSNFSITLNDITTSLQIGDANTEAADISILADQYANPINSIIYTNNPLRWNNLEIHYGMYHGFAPKVVLLKNDSTQILSAFMRIARQINKGEKIHKDFLYIPQENMRFNIEVLLDSTENIDSTHFNIKIENKQKQVYTGILKLKETVKFDDYNLTIPQLRRWCYVSVVKSPFLNLIFFGFWSALAGMVIGFISRILKENKNI